MIDTPKDIHLFWHTFNTKNVWISSFEKILFSFVDMLACVFMQKLVKSTFLLNLWIFNPLTIQVSTRGSSDTIIVLLIYVILYLLKKESYVLAALIYGFTSLQILISQKECKINDILIYLGLISGLFIALLIFFHLIYEEFLYQTYLYHFTRIDNRHNFSTYFYQIYLSFESITRTQTTLTYLPKFLIVILAGLKYYRDLPFAMLIQTLGFVVFNKVQTAQYFVCWIALIPLALQNTKMNNKEILMLSVIWLILEVQSNFGSYYLEIQGKDVFTMIFVQCVIFFLSNTYLMIKMIENRKPSEIYKIKMD
ncbi:unnamed protein product (macronuclear) [Paramecium tetraurelia]|uniref:GPI mannosyltransferase 1 n=1 Tax=Paramecium tetraurelia TaxID=5888 RepID=A0E4E7_PARTE|nr:uncharacterized protein GSPATT00023338001 [Paramecium tetraurelia]CAK90164.1 unnamed protein product [Paramecium tetraurelia]|eukprot:XP_001457561.1 hypothetical protein (macronuclear) [Paramecium tetraurelia strain d4-2]